MTTNKYEGIIIRETCKCGCGAVRDTYILNNGSRIKRQVISPYSHRYNWKEWKPRGEQIFFTLKTIVKK